MLYDRWRQIAEKYRDEIALRDLAGNRAWTFAKLANEVEKLPTQTGPYIFPEGTGAAFILKVLQGWKQNLIVCPLEAGQKAPHFALPPTGCVHLKTTSGSTDTPRCIAFTAQQLAADAENIVATMGLRRDWPNLSTISLAHSYGFSNLILPLLLHGIPLIIASSPLPQMVRDAASAEKQITLAAVPALWRAWFEADAIPKNVKLAISAGAPLPLVLEENIFQKIGLKIHNFYGASECGGIAYDRTEVPRTDAQCVGTAMENVKLSQNQEGCLAVRSAAVAQTYWPDADPRVSQGRFQASDLVEFKEDFIFLRGRASDQINIAGRKLSPETIERILQTHPDISECLVFGVPSEDSDRTENIVAAVSARTELRGDTLKQFLLEKIPAWQIPRKWWFIDALAANGRGKLSRAEWRRRFLEEQSRQS